MSMQLIVLAREFVVEGASADQFATLYMRSWKQEGVEGVLQKDDFRLSECCSDIFMHADCYEPGLNRDDSETDEGEFRKRVKNTLEKFQLL